MRLHTLGDLARLSGLARSSLLHYESLGLLLPAARSPAGYRLYGDAQRARLEQVRALRDAGLSLRDIVALLGATQTPGPAAQVLLARLLEQGDALARQRHQQGRLARLLAVPTLRAPTQTLCKHDWVALLHDAGFTEADMQQWHRDFEAEAPDAHAGFLASLGLPAGEIADIRAQARSAPLPPFPQLRTDRLVLREITLADAPALLAIHGDAASMRYFGTDPLPDLTAAQRLVGLFASWRLLPNPGVRWAISTHDGGPLLGTCGLFAWNRAWRKCSLGYELAPAARGRGYMREALRAVLDWGWQQMQLHRVEAQIHPANTASLALVQALGFAYEGHLREVAFWGGQYHDLLQYACLSSAANDSL